MKAKPFLILICAATLAAVLSAIALGRHNQLAGNGHARTFQVQGQIRSLDAANKSVRIAHEEIPHYMPAMIMSFTVKDAALLKGVSAGDTVQFELAVTGEDSWISHLEKVGSDGASPAVAATGTDADLQGREAERVQIGESVPDFKLLDQDGRTIHLSDYRGKAVVLTFIYTRCPLPNFCPLMSKNFSALEQRLRKEFPHQYQLLSVTMDPDFDRPNVLKDYAARYGASGQDWRFATGEAEQINFVAGLMGLYYARENGLISHDLRTALIGPDGRLVQLWKSNVWTPYEVQRMVRETFTGTNTVAGL
ncbi:MAG TPA: SCO family protein [Verrucomicrobiae bacterium]|nr:SCO family protein [Verrucomicrobiae bacterium]